MEGVKEVEVDVNSLPKLKTRLLTPIKFRELLLYIFDCYRKHELPEFLEKKVAASAEPDVQVAPTVSGSEGNDTLAYVPQRKGFRSSFWSGINQAGAYVSQTASSVTKAVKKTTKAPKHLAVIEFFTEEMNDIFLQEASALKKMTDLTILFYGLHYYITMATHSKNLLLSLDYVTKLLWFETEGHAVDRARMKTSAEEHQLSSSVYAVAAYIPQGVDPRLYQTTIVAYKRKLLELRVEACPSQDDIIRPEQFQFITRYLVQIQRVYELLLHNTTEAQKRVFFINRCGPLDPYVSYINTQKQIKPITRELYAYEIWQYRTRAPGNQLSPEEIITDLHNRWDLAGNTDRHGNQLQRTWSKLQLAVELLRPVATMGRMYDIYCITLLEDQYTYNEAEVLGL